GPAGGIGGIEGVVDQFLQHEPADAVYALAGLLAQSIQAGEQRGVGTVNLKNRRFVCGTLNPRGRHAVSHFGGWTAPLWLYFLGVVRVVERIHLRLVRRRGLADRLWIGGERKVVVIVCLPT